MNTITSPLHENGRGAAARVACHYGTGEAPPHAESTPGGADDANSMTRGMFQRNGRRQPDLISVTVVHMSNWSCWYIPARDN